MSNTYLYTGSDGTVGRSIPRKSHDTSLPMELLESILRLAAMKLIDDHFRAALDLQLVSIAARKLLLPVLYSVLVVDLPNYKMTDTPHYPPSFAFLLRLAQNHEAEPRRHIAHIIFTQSERFNSELSWDMSTQQAWSLDSIAFSNGGVPPLLHHLGIHPRTMLFTGKKLLRDFVMHGIGLIATPTEAMRASYRLQTFVVGPVQAHWLARHRNHFDYFSEPAARVPRRPIAGCEIRILLEWDEHATGSGAPTPQILSQVCQALASIVKFHHDIHVVVGLSRVDQGQKATSTSLLVTLRDIEASLMTAEERGRLVMEWATADFPRGFDDYAQLIQQSTDPLRVREPICL